MIFITLEVVVMLFVVLIVLGVLMMIAIADLRKNRAKLRKYLDSECQRFDSTLKDL